MKEENRISVKHWHGAAIWGAICVILVLIWELGVTVSLFHLGGYQESEINKIHIMVEYSAEDAEYSNGTTITDRKEIKKTIHALRRMKAYRGFYSVNDLPGQSPSAIITLYDSADESIGRSIHIYYDIALSDAGNYYGVRRTSIHRKVSALCKKYGESD